MSDGQQKSFENNREKNDISLIEDETTKMNESKCCNPMRGFFQTGRSNTGSNKWKKMPYNFKKSDSEDARGVYAAIILGASLVRLFIDNTKVLLNKELCDFKAYKYERPKHFKDKYESMEEYENYIEKRSVFSWIEKFDGRRRKLRSKADICPDEFYNDNGSRKFEGYYDKCLTLIHSYFPNCAKGEGKYKADAALLKTIHYSLVNYLNRIDSEECGEKEILKYVSNFSKTQLEYYLKRYSSRPILEDYENSTELGDDILNVDPIRIQITTSNHDTAESFLFKYCDEKANKHLADKQKENETAATGKPKNTTEANELITFELKLIAKIISSISFKPDTSSYEEKNSKINFHNYKFCIKYDENEPLEPDKGSIKNDIDISMKITKSDELTNFIDFQYNKLRLEKAICTNVEKLSEKYVDLNSNGKNIIDNVISTLKDGKSVLIYGSGGMGKSTISYIVYERLYKDYMGGSDFVPIIVNPGLFKNNDEVTLSGNISAENIIKDVMAYNKIGCNQNTICNLRNIILIIDGIDEYFSGDDELVELLQCTTSHVKLITGRTEICNSISREFIEGTVINLGDSITDKETIKNIFQRYSTGFSDNEINNLLCHLSKLKLTPLITAATATFLSKKKTVEYLNGKPILCELYYDLIISILREKCVTVKSLSKMKKSDGIEILSTFAWTRYCWPVKNYEDRIRQVERKTGISKHLCEALINEFTKADVMCDRRFLHESLQDYFVAIWVVKQSHSEEMPGDEFMKVIFRTDVQRFLGDFMKKSPELAVQITSFCQKMIKYCKSDDDVSKNTKQAVLMYMMARGAMVGDRCAGSIVKRHFVPVIREGNTSPQLAIALLCTTMLGEMDDEEEYYHRLTNDDNFAVIARIFYLLYLGDISVSIDNLEFDDIPIYFNNTAQRYLDDLGEYNLRDKRIKCLCRTQTVLIRTLLEKGYFLSDNMLSNIRKIETKDVLKSLFDQWFEKNLSDHDIQPDTYKERLRSELEKLRKVSIERSNMQDDVVCNKKETNYHMIKEDKHLEHVTMPEYNK